MRRDGQKNRAQVKSKRRVADHGEVFTAEREVNAMVDLVREETERLESKFLEPSCGDGNFLIEILRRKLTVAEKDKWDFERRSLTALVNLYGVELLPDNAEVCRERLFHLWEERYRANYGVNATEKCYRQVREILRKNIICGNMLTMQKKDGTPIAFAEWFSDAGGELSYKEHRLEDMLKGREIRPKR